MKKLLLVFLVLVLALVGCESEEKVVVEIENNDVSPIVDENTNQNDKEKTYFYLVGNDLFFTIKNGEINDNANSMLTLNDIANNNAYYSYKNVFEGNEKEEHNDLNIATYFTYSDLENHEDHYYDLIISSLNSDNIINTVSGESDEWFYKRNVTTYELPVDVIQNGEENLADCFGAYGANIRFDYGFVTNNPELTFINPEYTTELSEKAKEALDNFIKDNQLEIKEYEVRGYEIDITGEGQKDHVYLIQSNALNGDNNYPEGEDEYSQENRFSICFAEVNGEIIQITSDYAPMISSQKAEFWDNLGPYKEDKKITFADFDKDGSFEILLYGRQLELEPYDVYSLFKFENGEVYLFAELQGPNH